MSEEKRVIKTIEQVMPAVVSVIITRHLEDLEKESPEELYAFLPGTKKTKDGGLKIPQEYVDAEGMVQVGGGSGFIAHPNGIVITNKHVLTDPQAEYTVILNNGGRFSAKVISRDPINDVAILNIAPAAGKFPSITLGDAAYLKLGQKVLAIGNALGLFKNTVSLGIVSGLSRSIVAQTNSHAAPQEMRGLIQTDAAINPGNSGGPLVDLKGRAVGINAAIVSNAQNISFAIPIRAAKRDLADIVAYGRIRRPLLGVRYVMIDEPLKTKMGLRTNCGALVVREGPADRAVIPGSPAEKAGILEKDIILECNGKKLNRDYSIQDMLEALSVGDVVRLRILRGDGMIETAATVAERK